MQSIVDIEVCKIHTDLNVTDPLTKLLSRAKHDHTLIKFLKQFKMDQSKKGFLPVLQGLKLSKTQNSTTAEYIERMKVIPYASVIGSIKYVMLCTRPVVCLAMSLARGYNTDPGVDR